MTDILPGAIVSCPKTYGQVPAIFSFARVTNHVGLR